MRRLNEGDKIEVHGNPMLAGLNPGIYWIAFVSYIGGIPFYGLRKFRGRSIHVKHWAKCVDHLLGKNIRVIA